MSWIHPEVAWAARVFEGEGTITQSRGRLVVQVKMTDEEVIYRFATIVRWAEVYGPYQYEHSDGYKRKPFWIWHADECVALEVLELLWPWLSGRRKGQALDLAPLDAILITAALEASET
jgi:hypothetical protein